MGMQPLWTFTTNSIGLEMISVSTLVTCPLQSVTADYSPGLHLCCSLVYHSLLELADFCQVLPLVHERMVD